MYILGINISHHASSCLIKDGEILYFVEESKILRDKYFEYQQNLFDETYHSPKYDSFYPSLDILKKYTDTVDYVIFTSYGQENWDKEIIKVVGRKLDEGGIKYKTKIFYHENHHIYHAANAFYSSGFDDAVALVMDGGGSYDEEFYKNNIEPQFKYPFRESESIYKCDYNSGFEPLFKHYSLFDKDHQGDEQIFVETKQSPYKEFFTHSISCGSLFALLADMFNTGEDSAGKVMGLSSYGDEDYAKNPILAEDLFYELNGEWVTSIDPGQEIEHIMLSLGIDCPFDKIDFDIRSVYPDFYSNKIANTRVATSKNKNEVEKYEQFIKYATIAKKCQVETERQTVRLIQKALDLSGSKNVVLSGGYFLNCVNNFNYLKHFPDVNFFVDPISHDAGTAIGAAKWLYHGLSGDKTKRQLTNLYLGEKC